MSEPDPKRQKMTNTPDQVVNAAEDGHGDLFIRVGKDSSSTVFQTYSGLLRRISPVFKAMLGPKFLEGTINYTAATPLCLPDDDPVSFRFLCKVLHHQYDAITYLDELTGLVVLSDKYRCTQVIRPHIGSLFGPVLGTEVLDWTGFTKKLPVDLSLELAVCIAFLIGDTELFWTTSRRVIATVDTTKLEVGLPQTILNLLPPDFFARVHQQQAREMQHVKDEVERLLCAFFDDQIDEQVNFIGDQSLIRVATIQYCLHQWKKESGPNYRRTNTLEDSWHTVSRIADCCSELPGVEEDQLAHLLLQITGNSETYHEGLCLECVRIGQQMDLREKCRHALGT